MKSFLVGVVFVVLSFLMVLNVVLMVYSLFTNTLSSAVSFFMAFVLMGYAISMILRDVVVRKV